MGRKSKVNKDNGSPNVTRRVVFGISKPPTPKRVRDKLNPKPVVKAFAFPAKFKRAERFCNLYKYRPVRVATVLLLPFLLFGRELANMPEHLQVAPPDQNVTALSYSTIDYAHSIDFTGKTNPDGSPKRLDTKNFLSKSLEYSVLNGVIIDGPLNGIAVTGANFSGALNPDGSSFCLNPQEVKDKSLKYVKLNGIIINGSLEGVDIRGADFTGALNPDGSPYHINPQEVKDKSLKYVILNSVVIAGSLKDVDIDHTDFTGALNLDGSPFCTDIVLSFGEDGELIPKTSMSYNHIKVGVVDFHPNFDIFAKKLPEGFVPFCLKEDCCYINSYDDAGEKTFSHGTIVEACLYEVVGDESVEILPYCPSDKGYGGFAEAITKAVNDGCKVINCSWSLFREDFHDDLLKAIRYGAKHDVVFVWAAGNEHTLINDAFMDTEPYFKEPNVLVVGAIQFDETGAPVMSTYSNVGERIDIAESGNVRMIINNTGLKFTDGTSFAAPRAAGRLVRIMGNNPQLNYKQTIQKLFDSCEDILEPGKDIYSGHGIPNMKYLNK